MNSLPISSMIRRCRLAISVLALTGASVSVSHAQLVGGMIYPINGVQNPPASFSNITNAVAYMAANGVTGTGQVVLELQAGYAGTEPAGVTIPTITGASGTLGVTFRPGPGYTAETIVAGTSVANSFAIALVGNYLTLDGQSGGGGGGRNWTIRCTGPGTSGYGRTAVRLDSPHEGQTDVTVMYCVLEGEAASTNDAIVRLVGGDWGHTVANITVAHNLIRSTGVSSTTCRGYGIEVNYRGQYLGTGLVRDNVIRDVYACGIYYADGPLDGLVCGNDIAHTAPVTQPSATEFSGIHSTTTANTKFYNNFVHDIQLTNGSTAINGIYIGNGPPPSSPTKIYNNRVDIGAGIQSTTVEIYGIRENTPNRRVDFDYNSVYIGGSPASGTANSAAFWTQGSTILNIRNNIFFNARSNSGTASGSHWAIVVYNTSFSSINNNDYYVSGAGGILGCVLTGSWNITTLGVWHNWVPMDTESISQDPNYVAPEATPPDLTINPAVWGQIESGGQVVWGIDFDFQGNVRCGSPGYSGNGTAPDIGADEFDPSPFLSVGDITVAEGDAGTAEAVFTVTLSEESVGALSVQYYTADGTAVAGEDYAAVPTTELTFNPGDALTKEITVLVNGDTDVESDETFYLRLTLPVNVALADSEGCGTILNSDFEPNSCLGILQYNHDGTFEGWGLSGVGEGFVGTGSRRIECMTLWMTEHDRGDSACVDVYVLDGGVTRAPGDVIAARHGVTLASLPTYPEYRRYNIELPCDVGDEFTAAVWASSYGPGTVGCGYDQNGNRGHVWWYNEDHWEAWPDYPPCMNIGIGYTLAGIDRACCVGDDCFLVTQYECDGLGGRFNASWDDCQPNQCPSWIQADFAANPVEGLAPLNVSFTDQSTNDPTSWAWDFDSNGQMDATTQNPIHEYPTAGVYDVTLVAANAATADTLARPDLVHVYNRNTLLVQPVEITMPGPARIPISLWGRDPLGAISIYLEYDAAKLTFEGIESHVAGETFYAGIVGDWISVQWFDETGGSDPILPGTDIDTLFTVLLNPQVSRDTTQVLFHEELCMLGDRYGNPLTAVSWVDEDPYGIVSIDIRSLVSGRIGYYWLDRAVPNARLSMGLPNPDVWTDSEGHYAFERYPCGDYTLTPAKTTDLGGINSLDAVKVIRHSTGQEPFGNSYKLIAADVNGDGRINALDAIKIVRASVGLESLPTGDWRFDPASVNFAPLDQDSVVNFVGIRMGDVNGSWLPAGRLAPDPGSGITAQSDGQPGSRTISVAFPDTTLDRGSPPAQIPLLVTSFDDIGAVSLRISFADSVLSYGGVTSQVPGVSFVTNLVGDEIRIEWYDPTGGGHPISIGSDTLLTVQFGLIGDPGEVSPLDLTSDCALGDREGDPLDGVQFIDGSCAIRLDSGDAGPTEAMPTVCSLHPFTSPSKDGETRFTYELPRPVMVSLNIYDIAGRLVVTLVEGTVPAGTHVATWDHLDRRGSPMRSGVYWVRMRAGEHVEYRRILILR